MYTLEASEKLFYIVEYNKLSNIYIIKPFCFSEIKNKQPNNLMFDENVYKLDNVDITKDIIIPANDFLNIFRYKPYIKINDKYYINYCFNNDDPIRYNDTRKIYLPDSAINHKLQELNTKIRYTYDYNI